MSKLDMNKLMNDILKEIPQETVELFVDYLNLYGKHLLEIAEAFEGIFECEDTIKIYQNMASGISSCSIDLKLRMKRLTRLDPDKRKDI